MDNARTTIVNMEKIGGSFSDKPSNAFAESVRSSIPTRRIRKDTTIDAIYSNLACPNGCSRSAGLEDSLKLRSDITEAPASEKLLSASAVMATEEESMPMISFAVESSMFVIIPTILASVP